MLTRRLEVAAGERAVAKQEKSDAEQKASSSLQQTRFVVHGNSFDVEFISGASLRHRLLKSEVSLVAAIWLALHFTTRARQNIALNAALREKDLRIDLLTRRLEVAAEERAVAKQETSEAEQKVRDTETALLISEARSLALKGELVTATDKIRSLDNDVAQLNFALAIANASAAYKKGVFLADL